MDLKFLEYLQDPSIKVAKKDKERYERLGRHYTIKRGKLYFKGSQGLKKVPSVSKRHLLLLQVHEENGHFSYLNLIQLVKQNYFWPNLS